MSVMRRQAGLTALGAASLALAFLSVGYHVHGLSDVRADDDALDPSPRSHSISVVCPVCTLLHISPAPAVGCVGPHVPCVERRLKPPDAATLPHALAFGSHASRAPPALHDLWA